MCDPGLGSVLCRQEPEDRCLLKLHQNWEERAEDHLTLKQEEGELSQRRPSRGQARPGPQTFGVYRSRVGGVTDHTAALTALCGGPSGDYLYLARPLCRLGG